MYLVFIGSSKERADDARWLAANAFRGAPFIKPRIWETQDAFVPGDTYLGNLLTNAKESDLAVILMSSDAVLRHRQVEKPATNPNVLFELGVFSAALGPARVVVIVPAGSTDVLPSDYHGYHVLQYESGDTPEQRLAKVAAELGSLARGILSAPKSVLASEARLAFNSTQPLIVPVLRAIDVYGDSTDWYRNVRAGLKSAYGPGIEPKLLYCGPNLARNWIDVNSYAGSRATKRSFVDNFRSLLADFIRPAMNLVDLGFGDLQKANAIVSFLAERGGVEKLTFYPLDLSYEMLLEALHADRNLVGVFRTVSDLGGSTVAIHADYTELRSFRHLLEPSDRSLFMLLGSTLGNEYDETAALRSIAEGMRPEEDLLVCEVQMKEDVTSSAEEMTSLAQEIKPFFAGPFAALGVDARMLELKVSARDDEFGQQVFTYQIFPKRPLRILHPAIPEEIALRQGIGINVHKVKKYSEAGIRNLFRDAQLEILRLHTTAGQGRERRFAYIVARSQGREV